MKKQRTSYLNSVNTLHKADRVHLFSNSTKFECNVDKYVRTYVT